MIKYIILIIIRGFHYVQVLLIKTHRRTAGIAAARLLSEWHKSRCSSRVWSPGTKGQRLQNSVKTSTSETVKVVSSRKVAVNGKRNYLVRLLPVTDLVTQ